MEKKAKRIKKSKEIGKAKKTQGNSKKQGLEGQGYFGGFLGAVSFSFSDFWALHHRKLHFRTQAQNAPKRKRCRNAAAFSDAKFKDDGSVMILDRKDVSGEHRAMNKYGMAWVMELHCLGLWIPTSQSLKHGENRSLSLSLCRVSEIFLQLRPQKIVKTALPEELQGFTANIDQ